MTISKPKTRRTQAERTAESRAALLKAAIDLLHRKGYSGTTTELIAEVAGISRGALRHHFPTRAQLMAEVVIEVYEREHRAYQELEAEGIDLGHTANWPGTVWRVLSRPSGLAVIEILQACRSDEELAQLVAPAQNRVEAVSITQMCARYPGVPEERIRAMVRLFVWAIRGLSISQIVASDKAEVAHAVDLLREMVEASVKAGILADAPSPQSSD